MERVVAKWRRGSEAQSWSGNEVSETDEQLLLVMLTPSGWRTLQAPMAKATAWSNQLLMENLEGLVTESKSVGFVSGFVAKPCARPIDKDGDVTVPQEPWEPSSQIPLIIDERLTSQDELLGELKRIPGQRLVVIDADLLNPPA